MAEDRMRSHSDGAVAVVATLLEEDPSVERLAATALAAYGRRRPIAGWRLALPEACGSRRVDVLLPSGFPWSTPVVVLVDRPRFREWPHVERDGTLCLLEDGATTDVLNPRGVIRYLLAEAATLVAELASGALRDDFRTEFRSYWSDTPDAKRVPVISICDPTGPSRVIRSWSGRGYTLLGDSAEAIRDWLANRGRDRGKPSPTTCAAVLASLAEPPLPDGYPLDGASLLAFLGRAAPEAAVLAEAALGTTTEDLVVAMCAPTARGPAFVASILERPRAGDRGRFGRPDPMTRGFRPGRVPAPITVQRFTAGNVLRRVDVTRADASWVHGRDHGEGFARLRGAHVAFVGCGSLGSPTIRLLAQAGIGRMTLIDPDVLGWPNVGRHALGASSVGSLKASAMATAIRRDFPHAVEVSSFDARIERLLAEEPDRLNRVDAIVSTTGHWLSNAALQYWASETAVAPPLVFGWLEAHACAGHAIVIRPPTGCLHCGFDATGRPRFRVTEWEDGGGLVREPACGASFQPYGATEATMSATLIADTVLDLLLGHAAPPLHRIWAARYAILQRNGGRWSPEWLASSPNVGSGGVLVERPWTRDVHCAACSAPIAASSAA